MRVRIVLRRAVVTKALGYYEGDASPEFIDRVRAGNPPPGMEAWIRDGIAPEIEHWSCAGSLPPTFELVEIKPTAAE